MVEAMSEIVAKEVTELQLINTAENCNCSTVSWYR